MVPTRIDIEEANVPVTNDGQPPEVVLSEEQNQAIEIIEKGLPGFYFLTGRPGTGKSTIIHELKQRNEGVVCLSMTGFAALNIGGETIHRFCGFNIEPKHPGYQKQIEKFAFIKMLIIDEVSMVRVDVMTALENSLRYSGWIERDIKEPWGGLKVVGVGDLYQLAPVLQKKGQEYEFMKHHYGNKVSFHHAKCLSPITEKAEEIINLKTVYRQSQDPKYLKVLDYIRKSRKISPKVINYINTRVRKPDSSSVYLCSTRKTADYINDKELAILDAQGFTNLGEKEEGFPLRDSELPAPLDLQLKIGCRVMITANGEWGVNGDTGAFIGTEEGKAPYRHPNGKVEVKRMTFLQIQLDNGAQTAVPIHIWEKKVYDIDKSDDDLRLVAKTTSTYSQYPVKLAYAITIHKSQGLTLEKVHLNTGRGGAFAHGMVYVALSRVKTMDGLTLQKPLKASEIIIDPVIFQL